MSDETWNRYCAKLEELRRLEDERRKRRKESPAVEILNKGLSVSAAIPSAAEPLPGSGSKDNIVN